MMKEATVDAKKNLQIEAQLNALRSAEGVLDRTITELSERLIIVCTAAEPTCQEDTKVSEQLCPLAAAIRTSVNASNSYTDRLHYLMSLLQV
jgi:hypothetical protein